MLINDILLQAESLPELLFIMRLTLECCRQYNVSFRLAKMEVAGPGEHLTFAGFRASDRGFEPEKQRVRAITSYPEPQNLTDICSFMSLSQTLGRFLPNLTSLTNGLRLLLVKNTPFVFGPFQAESMQETKKALSGLLVKKPFDPALSPECTAVYCDAAKKGGLGFRLVQEPQDGSDLRLIQAGSRTLTKAEANYSILELKATAISWSVCKARFYLLAHPPFFLVMSDHSPLQYLWATPIAEMENPRLLRIREKVLGYNFKVIYKKGSEQTVADPLSRHAVDSPEASDKEEGAAHCLYTAYCLYTDSVLQNFREAANKDPLYVKVRDALKSGKCPRELPTTHPAQGTG